MSRRILPAPAALALALTAAPVFAADVVSFQTDWIPSGEHAAYYGAWEKGIYAEHGIDITITRGYGSGDTVTKLAAGGFDFGVADIGAVLTAKARQGVPVTVISTLYTHSPHSLFVLKSSGITDFSGLDGKRIGITPGNSHKVYFPYIAEQSGTDASTIRWVNMDGGAMAVQLIAKNIDAAPFYAMHHYFQNKAAMKAGEEIVVLPFVDAGFAIYAAGLITSDDLIEENPDLVRRFLAATMQAWEWARENPEEACELHVKRIPEVALDDCMGSLRATLGYVFNDHTAEVGVGRTDPERVAATWEAVAVANDLDLTWAPAQAFDTSLLPAE
ncbi:ABC transporter substrate-binding protein [Rubrimonas cliftonensis]|uniref:NitT/TauT family transport system substrate-binding protein n=1 Tax=Rubrimonas cliftonensis TaxID=89524 RepID=A0A1H4FMT4_9RHOB|nr:ABC transporter substrate-binding protein [Rubrimonas cliftonensis]SEA98626.1 NitT/TauT family transport system substrate-binding protein [Rubrimonas cliftonensis]